MIRPMSFVVALLIIVLHEDVHGNHAMQLSIFSYLLCLFFTMLSANLRKKSQSKVIVPWDLMIIDFRSSKSARLNFDFDITKY
jgi:hypothetical protein